VIIDVIDQQRVFIDGPSDRTGVARQEIKMAYLSLTDLKVAIPKSARLSTVRKAFEKAEIQKKWDATSWAKKLALKNKKATFTDFDRFKLMLARKKRANVVSEELRKLKKAHNKDVTGKKKSKKAIPRFQK